MVNKMGKFQNKVVVVTGASSGIGEATAVDFAKQGAKVVLTGRNKERLSAASKRCKDEGAEVLEFVGDLAEFNNLELLINKTVEKFGGIDILVNNAGYASFASIELIDVDIYENLFHTNVRAPVFLCKYALPHLKKTKGCVVNISSCAAIRAVPTNVPYSMTKAALDHFTRGFAAECAPFGVRVNCIDAGFVKSRFADGLPKEQVDKMVEALMPRIPFGVIMPEQISEVILFLCSSEMVTGVALPVDGGLLVSM